MVKKEPVYDDIETLEHDPELAMALGNMVVAWSNAEATLSFTMATILGISPNVAFFGFYRIPTFESRVKFVRALLDEWKPGPEYQKDLIDKTIESINDLAGTRNEWVHNVWCAREDRTETVIFNYRRPDGKGRRKPVKANEVNVHSKQLRIYTAALRSLIHHKP